MSIEKRILETLNRESTDIPDNIRQPEDGPGALNEVSFKKEDVEIKKRALDVQRALPKILAGLSRDLPKYKKFDPKFDMGASTRNVVVAMKHGGHSVTGVRWTIKNQSGDILATVTLWPQPKQLGGNKAFFSVSNKDRDMRGNWPLTSSKIPLDKLDSGIEQIVLGSAKKLGLKKESRVDRLERIREGFNDKPISADDEKTFKMAKDIIAQMRKKMPKSVGDMKLSLPRKPKAGSFFNKALFKFEQNDQYRMWWTYKGGGNEINPGDVGIKRIDGNTVEIEVSPRMGNAKPEDKFRTRIGGPLPKKVFESIERLTNAAIERDKRISVLFAAGLKSGKPFRIV